MRRFLQRFAPSLGEAFSPGTDRIERLAFAGLLVFVAVAPLPRGGVLPAGRLLIELSAFLIAIATFLSRARTRDPAVPAVPVLAMVAIAALGALQLVPLPDPLIARISPVSAKIYHETGELLGLFGRPAPPARVSIAPFETEGAIRLALAYLALFLASERLLGTRARRRVFAAVLLGAAGLHVAIAGSLQIGEARLHGTFANPDHFGGELEIALAVAFGVLWAEVLLNADRASAATDRAERVEDRLLPLAGRVVLWAVVAVGIALTQSRGAIAAATLTTVALLVTASLHPRAHRRRAWRGGLAVAAGLLLVALVAGRVPLQRFIASDAREFRGGTRLELWTTSLAAWKEFPWVGSGLGSFADAFRRVQPRELNFLVEQAHSDPLQLLVTGGAVGALFGAVLYVSLFVLLLRLWHSQKHREESAYVLAGIGALLSLTLHGLVEYNMSIPAIPATLACVLGMAAAAGSTGGGFRAP